MSKTVIYTDVYQVDLSIKLQNNLPVGVDFVYGLIDDAGVKWNVKSYSVRYADLNTVQKNRVDNLLASGVNIIKAYEGL